MNPWCLDIWVRPVRQSHLSRPGSDYIASEAPHSFGTSRSTCYYDLIATKYITFVSSYTIVQPALLSDDSLTLYPYEYQPLVY